MIDISDRTIELCGLPETERYSSRGPWGLINYSFILSELWRSEYRSLKENRKLPGERTGAAAASFQLTLNNNNE